MNRLRFSASGNARPFYDSLTPQERESIDAAFNYIQDFPYEHGNVVVPIPLHSPPNYTTFIPTDGQPLGKSKRTRPDRAQGTTALLRRPVHLADLRSGSPTILPRAHRAVRLILDSPSRGRHPGHPSRQPKPTRTRRRKSHNKHSNLDGGMGRHDGHQRRH